jgi:hypothetical protein
MSIFFLFLAGFIAIMVHVAYSIDAANDDDLFPEVIVFGYEKNKIGCKNRSDITETDYL